MREEHNKSIEQIDEKTTVINEESKINGYLSTHEITLLIRDLERKGNKNDIKHCVKISFELMEDGKIKIPSTITAKTWIIKNREKKNTLVINQVCDDILLTYNSSLTNKEEYNIYDITTADIIDRIKDFFCLFDDLRDEDLILGFDAIIPKLKEIIDKIFKLWSKFDVDAYVEQQEELIKSLELAYQNQVNPIRRHIKLLKSISNNIKGHTR